MLAKKPLTERTIQSLKPTGQRFMVYDALVPGFAVRMTETGYRTYVLLARFPGSAANPTARAIGTVGKVSLEWARARAREWQTAIAEGRDPRVDRAETFRKIAEEYQRREGNALRSAKDRQARLDRLMPLVGDRPLGEVRRGEWARVFDTVTDERGPSAGHAAYTLVNTILNWHSKRSEFINPLAKGMVPNASEPRERILSDAELRNLWAATGDGVFGAFVRFLLLTGCRRNEAAAATWAEIVDGVWTLPATRNKVGVEFARPLSDAAKAILDGLPHYPGFVFTTDQGRTHLRGFSSMKAQLDRASGVTQWTIHDCRRSSRSLMSRAGIDADLAERMLGHLLPGIRKTYDRHDYLREMGVGFEKLAQLVEGIVNPQDNVISLRG
jgi:integrase